LANVVISDATQATQTQAVVSDPGLSPKLDMSIEGMRSQEFSVGVFFFLLIGIALFAGILYIVVFGKAAPKQTKLGEKIMFTAIFLGIVVAVIFGALQMVAGYLF